MNFDRTLVELFSHLGAAQQLTRQCARALLALEGDAPIHDRVRKGTIHPWMKAYLGVFEHPYFALSGADGRFTLKDLPPGEYTIEAWHERFGTHSQKVALGPKETKEVEFAFAAG